MLRSINSKTTAIIRCTTRSQVAQQMQRTRDAMGRLVYYFPMNAFKFPGVDDVYFTCTAEMCVQCSAKVRFSRKEHYT